MSTLAELLDERHTAGDLLSASVLLLVIFASIVILARLARRQGLVAT